MLRGVRSGMRARDIVHSRRQRTFELAPVDGAPVASDDGPAYWPITVVKRSQGRTRYDCGACDGAGCRECEDRGWVEWAD